MINKDSNRYIIIFATIMVIVVALILSVAHEILKDTQQKNESADKMSQILRSIKIEVSDKETESTFNQLITDMYMVDWEGKIIPDSKEAAFTANLKAELAKPEDKRQMPVYVAKADGQTKYIMALHGTGLWGPLWGYIAVDADGNTIFGADFGHDSETPGLGAEISHSWFSDEFVGKQLFKNNEFKSVAIVKKGKTVADRDYVDGISGGTITGKGVDHMLYNTLECYSKFLSNLDKE